MLRLTREEFNAVGYDLDKAIKDFVEAREAHKKTEGVPAPTTFPLVEDIVKRHGGQYYVVEGKEYVRIMDGVVLDRRKFDRVPDDPAWSPRSRDDQCVGYRWDEESGKYLKPGVPRNHEFEVAFVQLQAEVDKLKRVNGKLLVLLATKVGIKFDDLGLTEEERLVVKFDPAVLTGPLFGTTQ